VRFVTGGGRNPARYAITEPRPDFYQVRFLLPDRYDYDQAIDVDLLDGGRVLHLSLWVGKMPSPQRWHQAHADLFPDAQEVRFTRVDAAGRVHPKTLPLTLKKES
jgi:hypothetical protein